MFEDVEILAAKNYKNYSMNSTTNSIRKNATWDYDTFANADDKATLKAGFER